MTARAHHYVPEFYLTGFTLSGNRQDALWVLDQEQNKSWRTRPANVAHRRDYYRVDIDGIEPDMVERTLAQFEGQAAEVLCSIREQGRIPEGDDFAVLVNFVALQATRVPYHREWYEGQATHLAKWQAQVCLEHPKMFEEFVDEMRRKGEEVPDFVTREGMLDFLEDESRYTIEIPREASIQHMVEVIETLVPIFAERNWSLVVAQDDGHDFICSDRPVVLVPTRPDAPPFLGYGMKDTEIIMPLNRQMSLVGHYDHKEQVISADEMIVGLLNQRMLSFSDRFVYSARDTFPVTVPEPP